MTEGQTRVWAGRKLEVIRARKGLGISTFELSAASLGKWNWFAKRGKK